MSILHTLVTTKDKSTKRVGRGYGSGKGGHTVGRGMKGSGARKSANLPIYFEGGQLPLTKRLPMIRGKSRFKSLGKVAEVNLGDLARVQADKITLEALKLERLVDNKVKQVKVIATGKLDKPIHLVGLRVSSGARQQIEAVGGTVHN